MYTITKQFSASYGHRVFSQDVNKDYAGGDATNGCHHLHGHQLALTVEIAASQLDHRKMVVDFKELGFIRAFVDACIDHRFIVSVQDPNFQQITGFPVQHIVQYTHKVFFHKEETAGVMFNKLPEYLPGKQVHLNSFLIVDFNPTSEELARWVYGGVQKVFDASPFHAIVSSVTWSETPKTSAVYKK